MRSDEHWQARRPYWLKWVRKSGDQQGITMTPKKPQEKKRPIRTNIDQAKRLVRIVIGCTVLLLGLAMVVLPGPAIIVIPVGLAILATEFVWAKRLMARFTDGANAIRKKYPKNRRN